jgi:prevent-host-death family protein
VAVFNITQAKADLSKLLKLTEQGEDVFLTKRKKLVARIVPVGPRPPRRKLDILRGKFEVSRKFFEPLPKSELDAWNN